MAKEKYTKAEIKQAVKRLPYAEDDWTENDFKTGRVRLLGTGHDAAYQYFKNLGGRPKASDPKILVSLRLPLSKVVGLKATGRGWQTRLSEFVVDRYDPNKIAAPVRKQA